MLQFQLDVAVTLERRESLQSTPVSLVSHLNDERSSLFQGESNDFRCLGIGHTYPYIVSSEHPPGASIPFLQEPCPDLQDRVCKCLFVLLTENQHHLCIISFGVPSVIQCKIVATCCICSLVDSLCWFRGKSSVLCRKPWRLHINSHYSIWRSQWSATFVHQFVQRFFIAKRDLYPAWASPPEPEPLEELQKLSGEPKAWAEFSFHGKNARNTNMFSDFHINMISCFSYFLMALMWWCHCQESRPGDLQFDRQTAQVVPFYRIGKSHPWFSAVHHSATKFPAYFRSLCLLCLPFSTWSQVLDHVPFVSLCWVVSSYSLVHCPLDMVLFLP